MVSMWPARGGPVIRDGQVTGVLPAPGDLFDFVVTETTVTVSWDERPGWTLRFSEDLERWTFVPGVTVNNGRASWTGPRMPGDCYFRLERGAP